MVQVEETVAALYFTPQVVVSCCGQAIVVLRTTVTTLGKAFPIKMYQLAAHMYGFDQRVLALL